MGSSLKRLVLPAYIFLCIAAGGSSQSILPNALLQIAAIPLIVWALAAKTSEELTRPSRQLLAFLAAFLLLIFLQLVPLPPSVWEALPGRELIAEGFRVLGYEAPWQPISMAPYATITSALSFLPPAAVLLMAMRIRQREGWLAITLVVCVLLGVLLGAVQMVSGGPGTSAAYLYQLTNDGAVGFFANRNHMGSLLLVGIPFGVALLVSASSRARQENKLAGLMVFAGAALLVLLTGVALNRSLAALMLVLPVVLFSGLLLPPGARVRRIALPAGAIAGAAMLILVTTTPLIDELTGVDNSSFDTRAEIWGHTAQLMQSTMPVGTGLGSFVSIYPLSEDPATTTTTFINHAHNDALEIMLELGVAGAILLATFLLWWFVLVARVWRASISTLYARAATIASGALLAHSLVDYPLRTAALAAAFALCLGLMSQPWMGGRRSSSSRGRPAKHVTIG